MLLTSVEARTRNFYDWELLGRGWRMYPHPVPLEPTFRPFQGHSAPLGAIPDDARKPTLLSSLWERVVPPRPPPQIEDEKAWLPPTPEPWYGHSRLTELEILIPEDVKLDTALSESWLRAVSAAAGPIAFEFVASASRVSVRVAADAADAELVRSQLNSFVPVAIARPAVPLQDIWEESRGTETGAIEFGLAREFMLPLQTFRERQEPLTALVGALARARAGEIVVLQVLLESARHSWAQSALRAVIAPDGKPFFLDAPQITKLAEEKCSSPLYAVAIRIAARSGDEDRTWDLLRSIAGALAQHGAPDRNELVPLASDDPEELVLDVLERTTHRSGMILSLSELSTLVRLPGESVRSPALVRVPEPEETLPKEVLGEAGVVLGEGKHKGQMTPVRLPAEPRLQHTYVIGGTGTGKSTLLENLILQDVESGAGVGVLDPHGDVVEDILARIPEERVKDVVLFDPADPEFVVGWNILGAHSEVEKDLLASDLVAVFKRLSTSWGDQMNVVLANAVLAFLESSRGGTLSDLRRFLLDDAYRTAFLSTVQDDHVASFWEQEFPLLASKKPQAPILTRLDTFLRSRLIRDAVTEEKKPLNFRAMIDDGAIFLAKLSQGAIGEENAALLGSLIVSKFHQVSLSRQDTALSERRPFFLVLDEFQSFATPSMASLFSGVRKYRLGLTVAHQDLYQLHAQMPAVERAVLANAYTRILFRVSDEDARKLEKGVTGFEAQDLANLGRGAAVCRVGQRDNAFKLKTYRLPEISREEGDRRAEEVRAASMTRYGRPREKRERTEGRRPTPPSQPARPAARPMPETTEPHTLAPELLPGRGGAVHKYVQGLVKEWGRAQGFRPEIEMQLPDGKRVDVALMRGDLQIACEIAGATTVEREVENIAKCLTGPFSHVCALSLDRSFLGHLAEAINARFTVQELERVETFSPEEFLAFLQAQGVETSEKRVRGYAVKVRHRPTLAGLPEESHKRAVAEVMLKSVKRLREERQ